MKNLIKTALSGIFCLSTALGFAQTWDEVAELIPADFEAGGENVFGWEVAVSGNYAMVGTHDFDQSEPGWVYVYEKGGEGDWTQVQKLIASDAASYDEFGEAIAMSGDFAVIGAWRDDDFGSNTGAAYVFERNDEGDWIEVQKLLASDAAGGDLFGVSVSIQGNQLIVGSNGNDIDGTSTGSAYIFERDDEGVWTETQLLVASDPSAGDQFGKAVSIDGDFCVIGAFGVDDGGTNIGAAYLFEINDDDDWEEVQKIQASDGLPDFKFGTDVGISGNYAIIGAEQDDDFADFYGAGYIFQRNDAGLWVETEKLTSSDAAEGDHFGLSVAIDNNYAVIGAYKGLYDGELTGGAAYVYKRTEAGEWPEVQMLSTGEDALNLFGYRVAIDENYIIAGASGAPFEEEFAAYIYEGCVFMDVEASGTEICEGDELVLTATSETDADITWSDDIENGISFFPEVGMHTYTATGGEEDCPFQIEINVLEAPDVTITTTDSVVCEGAEITLSADGAATYSWIEDVEDGVPFTPPVGETTYTVIGTGDNDCENAASQTITVNALPTVTATVDTEEGCDGDEITLSGEGAISYDWSDGVTDGESFAPPTGESTYVVTGTDDNDCIGVDSITITIYENPVVTFNTLSDDLLCLGQAPLLLGGMPDAGEFSGTGVSGNEFDPTTAGIGTYTLYYTYEDDNGCSGIDSSVVSVTDCAGVEAFDLLTVNIYPNPIADQATISFNQSLQGNYELVIYDVLGQLVFRKNNLSGKTATISKADLGTGLYFLSIVQKNEIIITKKITVE